VASYGNRGSFDTAAAKANNILSTPAHIVGDKASQIDDYFFDVNENRLLKRKVAELEKYRDSYNQLLEINKRYETLLNLRTEPMVEMVAARSMSVSRGPFNNNRLIDAGTNKQIKFGYPVINEHGLVGRVVGVSPEVSRVLMVTDVVSRVPVMIARSDARAMLSGDGGGYPRLEYLRGGKESLKKGDQILTSGDGGLFPRGLAVGEAVRGVDGVWRAKLYINRAPVDEVKVLKFQDFSQLPRADEVLKSPPVTDILPAPPEKLTQTTPATTTGPAAASNVATSPASNPPQSNRPQASRGNRPNPQNSEAQPRPQPTRPQPTNPQTANPQTANSQTANPQTTVPQPRPQALTPQGRPEPAPISPNGGG
jgi:rod shape-determining protein MreC